MDALQVHGWTLFAHPLFLDQVETLVAIARLALDVIPRTRSARNTAEDRLRGGRRHRFLAKFFQQCRLRFRTHGAAASGIRGGGAPLHA